MEGLVQQLTTENENLNQLANENERLEQKIKSFDLIKASNEKLKLELTKLKTETLLFKRKM